MKEYSHSPKHIKGDHSLCRTAAGYHLCFDSQVLVLHAVFIFASEILQLS